MPFQCIVPGAMLSWQPITDDVDLDHLAKVGFAGFSMESEPLSTLYSLEASHYVQLRLQVGRDETPSSEEGVWTYYLDFLYGKISFSSTTYLFSHLQVWTLGYLF